jgi:serine/threonine protein kinase
MARLLTCPKGHQWDPDANGRSAPPGAPVLCPMCGGQPETILPAPATPPSEPGVAKPIPEAAAVPPGSSDPTLVDNGKASAPPAGAWPSVPGYEIEGILGRGGMGVVYKARQVSLNRPVALKMVLAGPHAGPGDLDRFRNEAEAVAQFQHPNIVQIYEVGEHDGRPFLSLEYVDGGSLAESLANGQWPVGNPEANRKAAELVETLARAIHAAHRRNIVHRDLKPGNILLARSDPIHGVEGVKRPDESGHYQPKITDFGLAKRLDGPRGQTRSGSVLGTPCYMAPEQAGGKLKTIGPATDVYALGTILYELLTGRPPFQAESDLDTLMKVAAEEPSPPSRLRPGLPRDLEAICLKCLRKDPAERFGSALALADELRRFLDGEPIRTRPPGRGERARRWARRHRESLWVLAGVLATLCLVLAVIGSGLFSPSKKLPKPHKPPAPAVPGPPPALLEPLPEDLALVPPDALAFVTVRLGDLVKTKGVERLEQRVSRDVPDFAKTVREEVAKMERMQAFGPATIERVTLVVLEPLSIVSSVVAIIHTSKPFNADGLLKEELEEGFKVRFQHGKKQYVSHNGQLAVQLVSERTFVIGYPRSTDRLVATRAEKRARGLTAPLGAALRQAAGRHHLVAGINPRTTSFDPALFRAFLPLPPTIAKKLQPLLAVHQVSLALDLDSPLQPLVDTLRTDWALVFPDEARAKPGETAAEEGRKLLQENLRKGVAMLTKAAGIPPEVAGHLKAVSQFLSQVEFGLRSATVRREGKEVHVLVQIPIDLPAEGVEFVKMVEDFTAAGPRLLCVNQLRQIAFAMHRYQLDHGHLPLAVVCSKEGRPLYSWRVLLLPYLGREDLFRQFNLNERWDSEQNKKFLAKMPEVFRHPLANAKDTTLTYYQVFDGPGAAFEGSKPFRLADFTDGTANTILVVEAGAAVPWTKPADVPYQPTGPLPKLGGHFKTGFCVAMADAATLFLNQKVPEKNLRAAITRNGNEIMPKDWNK